MYLQRIQPDGIVLPVPLDCTDRQVCDRAGLAARNDLRGSQTFILNIDLPFPHVPFTSSLFTCLSVPFKFGLMI